MADGGSESNNSWESWFGDWVQSAKEKSSSALEFVKKDLAEFTTTLQHETEKAVEKTSSSITKANTEQATNKVKAGISSFFDNISKALVIPPDDDYVPMMVSADGTSLYDRGKARVHALQLDATTYVDLPHGPSEQYTMWLESFDMDQHKGEISEMLVSKVEIRALYTKLVPNEVSHADFWQRYFYKLHQLQCDEARKQALMMRADQTRGDSLSWEDDWSGGEEGDEEEDDGNQSDWEKMPRPPQSSRGPKKTSSNSTSNPPVKTTKETNRESPPSPPEASSELRGSGNPESVAKCDTSVQSERLELEALSSNSQSSATAQPTSTPSTEKKAVNATVKTEVEVSGSHPSQPSPELWSPQVPSDIACASHPEVVHEGTESGSSLQPGSSPDTHHVESSRPNRHAGRQKTEAPGGAAAACMELPSSDDIAGNLTADGACGAVDMGDISPPLPQPSNTQGNLDIPAASSLPSSMPGPANVQEDATAEDTVQPANVTVDNSASSPAREIHEEVAAEVENSEQAVPVASVQDAALALTVEVPDSNTVTNEESTEIGMRIKGDMVVIGETGSSPSTESSDTKDLALDEDWEQDFDVEVTEEDLKAAEDIAKKLGENLDAEDDDWENWE